MPILVIALIALERRRLSWRRHKVRTVRADHRK